VGLHSDTHSNLVVIGAILVIAITDSMSDALGIHVSEESRNKHSTKEIWTSTIPAFWSKFIFTLTFVIPVLFLQLSTAIIVCIVWELSLITIFSYYIAMRKNVKPHKIFLEHLIIAILVIIATHHVGD